MKKILFLTAIISTFILQNLFSMEEGATLNLLEVFAEVSKQLNSLTINLIDDIKTESDQKIYSISYTQGHRYSMEDCFDFKIEKEKKFACFGIFDGHAGKGVAEYLKNNLFGNIIKSTEKNIYKKFNDTFLKTNEEILGNNNISSAGSTAITVFFFENDLLVANVGDSRAIISTQGIASLLSIDHTARNESEKQRIINLGGFFINKRIRGMLEPTRAFGDFEFKEYIIPEPEIFHTSLIDQDEFIILACDGLWDVIKIQEAVNLIKRQKTITEMSKALVKTALDKQSGDNITVIVINLKELKKAFENHG